MSETKWYLRTQNDTFGPETEAKLVEWAKLGRIQPGQEISDDNVIWHRVEDIPFLDMRFSIDIGDGNPRGPFNRAAAEALLASGRLPRTSTIVEVREPFEKVEEVEKAEGVEEEERVEERPVVEERPTAVEPEVKVVEKEVVKEVRVEVPVEKIVEKEVIKEVRVEVPVEKIVAKIVEVPVHDRVEVVEAEVIEPTAAEPVRPQPAPHPASAPNPFGGAFRGGGRNSLAALEAALQRELAAANRKKRGFGFFGGK